jgi:hypothetical protein
MISKPNEVKRSKMVMAFWMEKGWMKYVSLKKGSYREIPNYVIELFEERERLMDLITDAEVDIEEGTIEETPEMKKQMADWEEIYQTIDLELHLLHDRHVFSDLYTKGHRYRGFEVFCYEDDAIPEGFYCKVEQLDMEFEGEECATYLYIDTPIELISLFEIADSILDLDTELLDPAIEITLLSKEDVTKIEQEMSINGASIFTPISSRLTE